MFHTGAWQCSVMMILPLTKVRLDGLYVVPQLQGLRGESLGNKTFQTLLEKCILTVFLMGSTDSLKFFYLPMLSWVVTKGQGNIICMFSLINFNPAVSLLYPGEVVPHSSVLTL